MTGTRSSYQAAEVQDLRSGPQCNALASYASSFGGSAYPYVVACNAVRPLDNAAEPKNVRGVWNNPERLAADSADRESEQNATLP
jgi:hypothetical protein